MAKVAYILLCHKDPKGIAEQANLLTSSGDFVSIHFDANARAQDFEMLKTRLADNPNVAFVKKRVKCGWGEWSLVKVTLAAVELALQAFESATHFYMLSGDCMPIKTAEHIHDFLDARDVDYIESFDFFESGWIKTGIKEDRLVYRHFWNERKHKKAFYASLNAQRRLGLDRPIPKDVDVMIGSQWWCLRRRTMEWVVKLTKTRKDIMRFFKTTWIPDETFFQTLVPHVVPENEIDTRTLTFLVFTDYGMPAVFHNDHYDFLLAQDYLFTRKVSPEALELKSRYADLYRETDVSFTPSGQGKRLHKFLTERGREGQRFAPRFWETDKTVGSDRKLYVVVCKKWHVAKRLVERMRGRVDIPALQYLFNEEDTVLPDLGGIQATLSKRTRHRRVVMRMLYDDVKREKLLICMDPRNLDLLEDMDKDQGEMRILDLECEFSDQYLMGHAKRIGLLGENVSTSIYDNLMPTLHYEFKREAENLRAFGFEHYFRMPESASIEARAGTLARFLEIPLETATEVAEINYLFKD
ncbi:MAG: DUF5928 domain-containing protein [Halocynthiibacter sp.]